VASADVTPAQGTQPGGGQRHRAAGEANDGLESQSIAISLRRRTDMTVCNRTSAKARPLAARDLALEGAS